jgi:uncharacterized alpha-E superfamily protein
MLSRVADSLYWMSRYLERAEHTVRLIDVNMSLMLDEASTSADLGLERRWNRVLACLGRPAEIEWKGDFYELTRELTFSPRSPSAVVNCIGSARENARQVRDELSSEQWQQLNRLYHNSTAAQREVNSYNTLTSFLPTVVNDLHQFQGVTDSTMSHGEGWQFIQLGRYIERAAATTRLLDVYHRESTELAHNGVAGYDFLEGAGMLRCCSAFEAYCNAYTADFTPERITEFLLLNSDFPHSVRYSVDCLRSALMAIGAKSGLHMADELVRVSGRLQASLSFVCITDVLSQDVSAYLSSILQLCRQVHERVFRLYIQYSIQTALATS